MLEVFRVPQDLQENLIAFCGRQNCYNLQELDSVREDLIQYCGAYLLYYQGDFSMYNLIKQANLNKCCLPIYVGKAAPGGRRTGVQLLATLFTDGCQSIESRSKL